MNNLRIYRLNIEQYPFFNNTNQGIALFDLILTFAIAYYFETYITNTFKIKKQVYYLSLVPFGILVHHIIGQKTFLNDKISNSFTYQLLFCLLLYYIYTL